MLKDLTHQLPPHHSPTPTWPYDQVVQQGEEKKFCTQWVADFGGRIAGHIVSKTINFVYTKCKHYRLGTFPDLFIAVFHANITVSGTQNIY